MNKPKGWIKQFKDATIGTICAVICFLAPVARADADFTAAAVPSDGVYKFTFGVSETQDGSIPVPADAVCDVNGTMEEGRFSYGFLGTTDDSYKNDVPSNLPGVPHAIDGFSVVKGQKIVLHDTTDANGDPCVTGPAASEYLPAGASTYEGRYPIRFSMRAEERAYYAVTCTLANASTTANADVTLFSERCHTHAQHLTLAPGETKTFAWSVELAPNYFKTPAKYYNDNAINVVVVGKNAALASLTVVKQPTTTENATVRGVAQSSINVGRTMWLCDDSTGTDQSCNTPYFTLQNYSGVGSGLSRWAPANLSIRNQGEGGLATGSRVHRESCLLKPGDYLYVEYGHNESNTESYTANLDQYLADANAAGANLVIVSPLERHNTWDSANSEWGRSLQGYAEAGEAWVEAKIAAGARNVAFIDLNKPFADWMNAELVRINGINPSVSLRNAIDYYFYSAKGGKVDATHPNNAGADWGAYFVWSNALERVAAGEADGATDSQRFQAAVLKGITEGIAESVANDTPWLVTDDIIAAGAAPNSFWDAAVRAGYDYVNNAAVAAVDATCADGVVTLSGVAMRVMNKVNYAKAVIDVVSADAATTNRYWSYYNYDASGNSSGDVVVPEVAGFIDADLDKDDPGIESHVSPTLTIPAGAKAYIWFAEADGSTWQVGDSAPFSAIYPLEAWTAVLVDDDCSDATKWTKFTKAVHTFDVSDEGDYIAFTSTAKDSNGYHAPGFFYKTLPSDREIDGGRVRVSFKTLYNSGNLHFLFANSIGSNNKEESIVPNSLDTLVLSDAKAAIFGSSAAEITLSTDETPVTQNDINDDFWLDVDMILDFDKLQAQVSVGGSDYREYVIPAPTMPFKYFGIRPWTYATHDGAIDEVRIVALAPTPQVAVSASVNNAAFGSVTINGAVATEANVFLGADVALKAVSADADLYRFVGWQDENGATVSTKQTLVVEDISEGCSYTAVFREYEEAEDRVIAWDFAGYAGDFAVAPSAATIIIDNGMEFSLQDGDSMTANGLVWHNSALGHKGWQTAESLSETADHYIIYTPSASGVFTLKFSIDNYNSSRTPQMFIMAAESFDECTKTPSGATVVEANKANTEFTLSAELEGGKTYYVWTYSNNWVGGNYTHNYTISSITYTYALVRDAAFDVAEGETTVQVGAIAKANNVEKTGAGTLVLVGNNDFAGTLLVGAGTVRLGTAVDIPGATADFDASAEGAVMTVDGVFTWKDSLPGSENALTNGGVEPTLVEEEGTMNGHPALKGASFKMNMKTAVSAKTTFLAMHPFCGTTAWNVLMTDNESYSITCRNSSPWNRKGSTNSAYYGTDNIWQNGVDVDGATQTTPMVMSIIGQWTKSDPANVNLGWNSSSGTQAYSELLTYSVELSDAEREAVEAYLMAKWGIGEAVYSPLPAAAGVEVASGATLDLGGFTQRVASLSVAANGVVTNGTLVVSSQPSIEVGAYAAATDNGDGTWTVEWSSPVAVDTHSFTWNWKVAEGNWNDPANWLYEGVVPATTYPTDAENDYVTFNTAATVNLGTGAAAKEVWFNADVTLTGGTLTAQLITTYDNQGEVTLSNAGFATPLNTGAEISCPIVMTANTTNHFNTVADKDWGCSFALKGDISGEGCYQLNLAPYRGCGFVVSGNNNGFAGDAYTTGGKSNRSPVSWSGEYSAGTNTYWHIGHSYRNDANLPIADTSSTKAKVGGYDGTWVDRNENATVTIGYLNRDSRVTLYNVVSGRKTALTKVGSANLTLGSTSIRDLTINGGSVTMPVGIAPNTLIIAEGTKIIIPGDSGWGAGTVTNLFSYTTLQCVGELARQVEVTGLAEGLTAAISVADNTVTATIASAVAPGPTTEDEDASIEPVEGVENTYAYTPGDDGATSATVANLPADAKIRMPVQIATVTGVTAEQLVVIGGDGSSDITPYLAIAVQDGAVVIAGISPDKAVEVEATALNEDAPFLTDADGAVTDISTGKTIPGLKYSLLECGSLGSWVVGASLYGNGEALTLEAGASGADLTASGFFKVEVSK